MSASWNVTADFNHLTASAVIKRFVFGRVITVPKVVYVEPFEADKTGCKGTQFKGNP